MSNDVIQQKMNEAFKTFKSRIAVHCGSRRVTYEELEKTANAIAQRILQKKIPKEAFIGILSNDRVRLIAAILGILKARGVFIPLDTGYPRDRLELIIQATDIKFIIGDTPNIAGMAKSKALKKQKVDFILNLEELTVDNGETGNSPLPEDLCYSPEDKVYVYFTSGTTGIPKAIVGKNRSLLHFINWEIETFAIDETFRFSQFTNPGFDVYLRDLFVPLCAGATICIPENREIILSSEQLINWLDSEQIHLVHCVPSLFRLINIPDLNPGNFKSLKYILFAGEKVIPRELKNWYKIFAERIQLVNLYGPTETTLAKVFYRIQPSDSEREIMPIGQPIRGARVIILDEHMNPCEKLVIGEIYLRTPYRTYGYYKDPGLNREKFIPNPFNDDPQDIIYKTGDLGQILPDGNIELVGRVDRQVKIRGMRVELEEVENTLLKYPAVKEGVVTVQESKAGSPLLVALITLTAANEKNNRQDSQRISQLKQYMSEKIPDYMVPAEIVVSDKIPRKLNGKVDYEKAAEIIKNAQADYIQPRDRVEKKLMEIWCEQLGLEKIGIRNNFFQLGGNSLTVMSLIAKIHCEFGVRIALGEIFKNNTIEKQAQIINASAEEKFMSIEPAEEREYYALAPAQKRLYIVQQMESNSSRYNLPVVVGLAGDIDTRQLQQTFAKMIKRHESLRTAFETIDGEPVQRVYRQVKFQVEYFEPKAGEEDKAIEAFIRPFDLSRPPSLRVGLLKVEQGKFTLMADMHHIISDGVSQGILVRDFMRLYPGEELSALKLQYRDYAQWFNRARESARIAPQESFWLKQFQGPIPELNIPTDYERPPLKNLEGDHLAVMLDTKLSEGLTQLAQNTATTIYMVLLAVYNILLAKYAMQEDIVVGSPITGRNHPDLQNIIGMFVNMLAMRNRPQREKSFHQFLLEVKENTLAVFENQDYPFDELVGRLKIQRTPERNPLFNTVLAMQNMTAGPGHRQHPKGSNALKTTPHAYENKISRFDITIFAVEVGAGIHLFFRYSTQLFQRDTIERMAKHYSEILRQIVKDIDIKLEAVTISSGLLPVSQLSEKENVDFIF